MNDYRTWRGSAEPPGFTATILRSRLKGAQVVSRLPNLFGSSIHFLSHLVVNYPYKSQRTQQIPRSTKLTSLSPRIKLIRWVIASQGFLRPILHGKGILPECRLF